MMNTNPLVTIFLLSYNNEKFIAEALNSVLLQNYQPLQIIISDDCSPDRSFSIASELTEKYYGPHKIVFNKNEINLGIGGHINRIMELAEGELIIEADGDDISLPGRVAETVNMWVDSCKKCPAMCGESLIINEAGELVSKLPKVKSITFDKVLRSHGQWIYGGSLAWHRSLFDIFGPLRDDVVSQDKAIGFRSLLLGHEIGYIEKTLIKYRSHSSNITNDSTLNERLKQKIGTFGSYIKDFDTARSLGYFEDRHDIQNVYQEFTGIYSDFILRQKILTSGLLESIFTIITCGNKLSIPHKKSLFLKRIMRHD